MKNEVNDDDYVDFNGVQSKYKRVGAEKYGKGKKQ